MSGAENALRTQVRAVLKAAGISQVEACRRLDLSQKHLSQMLTGAVPLRLAWAERIADLCGTQLVVVALASASRPEGQQAADPRPVTGHRLDVPELHRLLDARRRERGLSWRDIADQCGLSSSTLSRIAQGHAPDAHGFCSLIVWLDLDTDLARLVRPREDTR